MPRCSPRLPRPVPLPERDGVAVLQLVHHALHLAGLVGVVTGQPAGGRRGGRAGCEHVGSWQRGAGLWMRMLPVAQRWVHCSPCKQCQDALCPLSSSSSHAPAVST